MTAKPKKASTKRPTLTDAERHKRFVEMARETDASEDPAAFDRAFGKVVTPPKPEKGSVR
jgi:hypothetical protein